MPEYVYALHDFVPENEDEIPFSAGDRIEVVEKDDLYGDGWWQGKNLFGKIGLFPQSYTTSDPAVVQNAPTPQTNGQNGTGAATPASVHTLNEEPEDAAVTRASATPGDEKKEEDQGVMRATMTDVQEAIEQLGRNDRDGNGSFSFASHTDTDRETDRETDAEGDATGDAAWHKGARSNLAEKARRQQELLRKQQEAYDRELQLRAPALVEQISEPPIAFEMSDESEGEEEDEDLEDHDVHGHTVHTLFPHREHDHISEEEEDDVEATRQQSDKLVTPKVANYSPKQVASNTLSKPVSSEDFHGQPPETARQISFPTPTHFPAEPSDRAPSIDKPHSDNAGDILQKPTTTKTPSPTPPIVTPESRIMTSQAVLPSPPASQNGSASSPAPKWSTVQPSEWSVDDVVEWAKSKGFDNTVCDKFIEHEITGDVLLELDENVLKTELEIHAFGKRKRIAKEVAELRRPPSIQSAPSYKHAHQRTTSQSMSLPDSTHHSLRSPIPLGAILSPESPPHTGDMAGTPAFGTMRRDSDPGSSRRVSETDHDHDPDSSTVNNSTMDGSPVGLGIGVAIGSSENLELPKNKNRPAYLNLSPSDLALGGKKTPTPKFSPKSIAESREERAALSDTESAHALESRSRRRRIFGRSTGSANSDQKENGSRTSKEQQREGGPATPVSFSTSTPASPSTKRGSTDDGSVKPPQRRKKSVDASKSSDRLSLFGGSISIGRSRKPVPRVQSYAHDDLLTEKHSRSFSRLYLGSGSNRKTSTKSQSSEAASLRKVDEKEENDSRVLRKRTTSMAAVPSVPGITAPLREGQSVLEQIGTPDHNGWMRKKGEHYNTWKMRYFVLKGPHLYYLRSNSKAETKIKGYINIIGYKVVVDENINPGKYGFRLVHDTERTHYFSSTESITIREWMKALMKATIGRDYSKPVISSCNIPTIPLSVAQTMNPAPRPPSPTQRAATQKALRRENPNQLSSRDARILMGLPQAPNGADGIENGIIEDKPPRIGDDLFSALEPLPENPQEVIAPHTSDSVSTPTGPPVRPAREMRRTSVPPIFGPNPPQDLIRWANDYLPPNLQVQENSGQIFSGLALFRLAEAIRGKPSEPPVPDSAFPTGPNDDRLDGLFKLFDFFLDNDIRMGNVSINDVRQGRVDKVVQLVRSLKTWEEKRKTLAKSIGRYGAYTGPLVALEPSSPA